MPMTFSSNKVAGALYLLPVFAVSAIWYVLLFVGNPSTHAPANSFSSFLNGQSDETIWLRWMLVGFPLLCLLLSAAYWSRIPKARLGGMILFCAGVLLAVAAWGTINPGLAGLVSAPLFFAFEEVRRHLTPHSTGTPGGDR